MSIVPIGLSIGLAVAQSLLNPVLVRFRGIGSPITGFFIPNIAVEEVHRDKMVITDHPVEQNAPVSDHAYKLPVEVLLRYGWSNSSIQSGGDPNYVQEIYQAFLTMQQARTPLQIFTGKRLYQNMLIEDMVERTDQHTENSMFLEITCREVIIVTTSVQNTPSNSVMTSPEKTGGTTNVGANSLIPAANYNPTQTFN